MRRLRTVRVSARALLAHRTRAVLALAGITLGVATVLVMVAIGEGAEREVIRGIESFGTNLLVVTAGKLETPAGRTRQASRATTLTVSDAEAIATECLSVARTVPVHSQPARLAHGNVSTTADVVGASPDYFTVRNFDLAEGRLFEEEDDRASLRVGVLGARTRASLFGASDPIGEIVRVGRVPFVVIGALREKGVSPDGADQDAQIVVPLRAALRRVFQEDHIDLVYVEARSKDEMETAEAEVRDLLRERHGLDRPGEDDDFTIQNLLRVRRTEVEAARSFTVMISGVAGISLLVGGVGIMSIMLLTVRERTAEIGLRMATGARRRDILSQFLVEALVLGLTGGLAGIGLGLGSAAALGRWTDWATAIPTGLVLLSLAVSLLVGLFFGAYPARRASLLDPIEALRRA